MQRAIRRAHLSAGARFDASATTVWSALAQFDGGIWELAHPASEVIVPGRTHWVSRGGGSVGSVEELAFVNSGRLEYRSRMPGGSALDDLDGVVRVSHDNGGSFVTWSAELVAGSRAEHARRRLQDWFQARLVHAGGAAVPPLQMETYLGQYRALARSQPNSARAATWAPTTATLVSGARDAVLIDAMMTVAEATDLTEWITATGKRLTHVIITTGHADHFYGLGHVLAAFPEAVPVAVPAVARQAQVQAGREMHRHWASLFPEQLVAHPAAPRAFAGPIVRLEDHELHLFDLGSIVGRPTSVVSVRALDAIIGGDLVYNMVHPWLLGSDRRSRREWWRALDLVEALRPAWVVASHRDPGATTDRAEALLRTMRRYLTDFDRAQSVAQSAEELTQYVAGRHPGMGNLSTLQASAISQFSGWRDRLPHPDFPDVFPKAPSSG